VEIQGLTTHIADPRWDPNAVEIECPQLLTPGVAAEHVINDAVAMVQPGETVRLVSPSWRHALEISRDASGVASFREYLYDPFEKVWDEVIG
jgi:hypothetical protein